MVYADRFTAEQIAVKNNISLAIIRNRCRHLKINTMSIALYEIDKLTDFGNVEEYSIPEVIYVTQTIEIYPSRLNFLKEDEL